MTIHFNPKTSPAQQTARLPLNVGLHLPPIRLSDGTEIKITGARFRLLRTMIINQILNSRLLDHPRGVFINKVLVEVSEQATGPLSRPFTLIFRGFKLWQRDILFDQPLIIQGEKLLAQPLIVLPAVEFTPPPAVFRVASSRR